MFTATLGGLIKDYRIQKRLSQLDISLRIGWRDTSRLSKIEQGRISKPTRETAEKIIKALELNEQEKGEFLLVGGYLPTEEEIKSVIKEIKSKIDKWLYPAYIMDFSWMLLYTNNLNLLAFNLSLSWKKVVLNLKPNVLSFAFLPKDQFPAEVEKGEDRQNLKPFAVALIAAYKSENLKFQNESWYKKTVQGLMKYEEFRKLWPKVDQDDYHKKLFDYEYKRITRMHKGKKTVLDFHISTAKFINDPRFQVVLYFPANAYTEKHFEK